MKSRSGDYRITSSVQPKNGRLHAVISYTIPGKKAQYAWRALGLDEGARKTDVNKRFREVVNNFEAELRATADKLNRPDTDIPIYEYLCDWLKRQSKTVQYNTTLSYGNMIHGRIRQHFEFSDVTIGSLTPKQINQFYQTIFDAGCVANTVIRYHSVLRNAFQHAFRSEMIESNPFDKIERPRKNKFRGAFFSEDELQTLLKLTQDDPIFIVILLAAMYGLRRSEALGVRWSRIDFNNNQVLIDTKVIEKSENGKTIAVPVEEMKTKSSHRTLPLIPVIADALREQKEKQDAWKTLFKRSYNREFSDYVCTNQLGELFIPNYVTEHFRYLLDKYGLRRIRFHDLRHTCASLLIKNGMQLINVKDYLGHSDIGITANIYAHLDESSKQSSAEIMQNIYAGKK